MHRDVKVYTLEEANALLPELRPRLARLRDAFSEFWFHKEQVEDLEGMWGREAVADPVNRDHEAYLWHKARAEDARGNVQAELREFQALGIEVKDPWTGLLDFYAMRAGELVYLCWREGEEAVSHWHTLTGGFGARKPL